MYLLNKVILDRRFCSEICLKKCYKKPFLLEVYNEYIKVSEKSCRETPVYFKPMFLEVISF